MTNPFESFELPKQTEIFSPIGKKQIAEFKMERARLEITYLLLRNKDIVEFLQGEPLEYRYNCTSLFELGIIPNPKTALNGLADAVIEGINAAARAAEADPDMYHFSVTGDMEYSPPYTAEFQFSASQ
jgi:hypothetical protein